MPRRGPDPRSPLPPRCPDTILSPVCSPTGKPPLPKSLRQAAAPATLAPLAATAYLAAIVVALAVAAAAGDRTMLFRLVPLQRSPDVLEDRAAEIVRAMGYVEPAVDTARGIELNAGYLAYVAEHD